MTIPELAQLQQRQNAADALVREMMSVLTTDQMCRLCELWAHAGKLSQESGKPDVTFLYVCATTQMMHEVLRRHEDELA